MTDRDALIAAIHAAPDDDAPPLVFADWLDEHGEYERAEFIRIQVEMRRERERHDRITSRLDELFLRQKDLFRGPWVEAGRRIGASVLAAYTRGFPNSLNLSAKEFVAQGSALNVWIGPQTRVCLIECGRRLSAVAQQPSLLFVRSLTIARGSEKDQYTDADVAKLLDSPHLTDLHELTFEWTGDQSAQVGKAIASAASLSGLQKLDLTGIPLRAAGVTALAKAAHLTSLKKLYLRDTEIGSRAAKSLVASRFLVGLEELDVRDNRIPKEDFGRLYKRFGRRVVLPSNR